MSINLKEKRIFIGPCFYRVLYSVFFKFKGMIRKLKSGQYRIYSRKKDPKTNKRRNLGTFESIEAAKKHEKAIQYFKHG